MEMEQKYFAGHSFESVYPSFFVLHMHTIKTYWCLELVPRTVHFCHMSHRIPGPSPDLAHRKGKTWQPGKIDIDMVNPFSELNPKSQT